MSSKPLRVTIPTHRFRSHRGISNGIASSRVPCVQHFKKFSISFRLYLNAFPFLFSIWLPKNERRDNFERQREHKAQIKNVRWCENGKKNPQRRRIQMCTRKVKNSNVIYSLFGWYTREESVLNKNKTDYRLVKWFSIKMCACITERYYGTVLISFPFHCLFPTRTLLLCLTQSKMWQFCTIPTNAIEKEFRLNLRSRWVGEICKKKNIPNKLPHYEWMSPIQNIVLSLCVLSTDPTNNSPYK